MEDQQLATLREEEAVSAQENERRRIANKRTTIAFLLLSLVMAGIIVWQVINMIALLGGR